MEPKTNFSQELIQLKEIRVHELRKKIEAFEKSIDNFNEDIEEKKKYLSSIQSLDCPPPVFTIDSIKGNIYSLNELVAINKRKIVRCQKELKELDDFFKCAMSKV